MFKFVFLFVFLFISSYIDSQTLVNIDAEPGGSYFIKRAHNINLLVSGSGSVDSPFVIDGRGISLTGDSHIRLSNQSSNIIIKNIKFVNNEISHRKSTGIIEVGQNKKSLVNNIIIQNIEFYFKNSSFSDKDKKTQFYWIRISGNNILVKNCIFEGKRNRLPIIHIDSGFENVLIKRNIFKNVPSRVGEALEAIRVGLEDGKCDTRITENTFLRYSGDSETISIKASGVQVDNNQFIDCRSGVVLDMLTIA